MYSKSNSTKDYITLLYSLETLTTELKKEIWPKRQRKKTKKKETQFNHGPANITQSNVTTRSRRAASAADLSSLMLRSNLTPVPFLPDEAEPPSVPQETTIIDRSNVADNQSEITLINLGNSTLKVEARPAATNTGAPVRDRLKQEIERCKMTYRGKTFVINGDDRSEIVYPDEISSFFSRFQEGMWLTNFNLMPLLFSFR